MRLETDRLYIRSLQEHDWQEMKEIFIDFSKSEYACFDWPMPTDDEGAISFTEAFVESGLCFVVFLKETRKMIGYVCFHKDENTYDLGYCFHSSYQSNGYAYESVYAVIEYLIDVYSVEVFTAGTALDNVNSCRLLDKLGFVQTGTEVVSFVDDFSFQGGIFSLDMDKFFEPQGRG